MKMKLKIVLNLFLNLLINGNQLIPIFLYFFKKNIKKLFTNILKCGIINNVRWLKPKNKNERKW